jgi:hypothetical protein
LNAGCDQIDRALVHYKEAYEALNPRSSYELRWKIKLNYARALHDAALWHRYDSAIEAKNLFNQVLEEYNASGRRWFWQPKLTDLGIKRNDIIEPLRDIEALELQRLFVSYSWDRDPSALGKLSSAMSEFVKRFNADESALSKRLYVNRSEIIAHLGKLSLVNTSRSVLIELDDGNFLVKRTGYESPTTTGRSPQDQRRLERRSPQDQLRAARALRELKELEKAPDRIKFDELNEKLKAR